MINPGISSFEFRIDNGYRGAVITDKEKIEALKSYIGGAEKLRDLMVKDHNKALFPKENHNAKFASLAQLLDDARNELERVTGKNLDEVMSE